MGEDPEVVKIIRFLILTICIGIAISLSISRARANTPPRFDPEIEGMIAFDPFVFIVAEICGLVAGVSVLILGAKEDGGTAARIIIFTIIISYLPAYLIWQAISTSRVLSSSSNLVLHAVVITLIPEVLGTVLGTIFIRRTLEVRWKWALLSMGALMLSSFLVGQLLYTYTYKRLYPFLTVAATVCTILG